MTKSIFARLLLFVLLAAGLPAISAAAAKEIPTDIVLFSEKNTSVSDWKDKWGSIPSGCEVKTENHKMVLSGNLSNQSYGCVYRALDVDLDSTPFLEIDVESISHHWYLICRGEQLPNGWVKIQPDTDQTGKILYDLRLALGLTGKQSFSEIQLGVSTEESVSGNKGQTLVLNRMALLSAVSGADDMQLYGPQNRRVNG